MGHPTPHNTLTDSASIIRLAWHRLDVWIDMGHQIGDEGSILHERDCGATLQVDSDALFCRRAVVHHTAGHAVFR